MLTTSFLITVSTLVSIAVWMGEAEADIYFSRMKVLGLVFFTVERPLTTEECYSKLAGVKKWHFRG